MTGTLGTGTCPRSLQAAETRGLAVYRLLSNMGRTGVRVCVIGKPAQMVSGDHIIEVAVTYLYGKKMPPSNVFAIDINITE